MRCRCRWPTSSPSSRPSAVERAHVVGRSYGGRLAFGVGEHAPDRVLSLVARRPAAVCDESRTARSRAPSRCHRRDATRRAPCASWRRWRRTGEHPFRRSSGTSTSVRTARPSRRHSRPCWPRVTSRPGSHEWRVPCLIYLGAGDEDFFDQARRAAAEIPNAEFVGLDALDHLAAHYDCRADRARSTSEPCARTVSRRRRRAGARARRTSPRRSSRPRTASSP